jgi:ribosomal-protein-alanine N-acetyltransferase
MISLETERLVIRNFAPDDWQALQEVIVAYQASDSAQYEDPWPTSDKEVRGIAGWFASGNDYLAVCLKETGTLLGLVAINRRTDQDAPTYNLGYVFHPGYAGHGYATESCRAAMAYLFDELGIEGILTGTHPDNKPSVALLKRLGLREKGDGEWTLSKAEWISLERERNGS